MTNMQEKINEAYSLGYERGYKDGEMTAGMVEAMKKADNVFDNGEYDKFIENLKGCNATSTNPINRAIFSSLESLAIIVKELERRTR